MRAISCARTSHESSSQTVRALSTLAGMLELDLDVEVARIALIRRALKPALDLIPLGHVEGLVQVKHRLLPVRVGRMRACGERDRHAAARELAVEKGDESVEWFSAGSQHSRKKRVCFEFCASKAFLNLFCAAFKTNTASRAFQRFLNRSRSCPWCRERAITNS